MFCDKQTRLLFVVAAIVVIGSIGAAVVTGAEPKPYVRMTSPKTCSGVVVHASRVGGIHILTCAHCTTQEGAKASFTLFMDGDETPDRLPGFIVKVHSEYQSSPNRNDVAYCWIPPENYPKSYPLPNVVQLVKSVKVGQPVLAVGTNASKTKTPAMRELKISEASRDGRYIKLNDGAWGGHSGGPVFTVSSQPKLIGVLWGRDATQNSYSSVTGPAALHELVNEVACSGSESNCTDQNCQCPGGVCRRPNSQSQSPQNMISQVGNAWNLGGESEIPITQPPPPPAPVVVDDSKVKSLESMVDRLQGKLDRSQDSVQRLTLDLTKKTAEVDILVTKYEQLDAENKSLADSLKATEAQIQQLSIQVNTPQESVTSTAETAKPMNSLEIVASARENMEEQIDNVGQMREILNQVPGSEYLSESAKSWLLILIAAAIATFASYKHGEKKNKAPPPK